MDGVDFSVNVISKSGTTTEPALAFRVLRGMMEQRYGKEAAGRIYCTTDRARGTLKSLVSVMPGDQIELLIQQMNLLLAQ